MEVVVTTRARRRAKLQSNRHHQQTNTQLLTGWMPFLSLNQQCQSIEGRNTLWGETKWCSFLMLVHIGGPITEWHHPSSTNPLIQNGNFKFGRSVSLHILPTGITSSQSALYFTTLIVINLWQYRLHMLLSINVLWVDGHRLQNAPLTDLSVISFHISPAFFVSSVTEIPGNCSLIVGRFSFSHRKNADCGRFGLSGSTSFFG